MAIELLGEDGDLTPNFESVLSDIFDRFDIDRDGRFSLEELKSFALAANGTALSDDDVEQITGFFDCVDGMLTKAGFSDMYHTQTSGDEPETWKDLKKLGYNDQLMKE
jgi:Ca2+-binding EF-hand superfamily protein